VRLSCPIRSSSLAFVLAVIADLSLSCAKGNPSQLSTSYRRDISNSLLNQSHDTKVVPNILNPNSRGLHELGKHLNQKVIVINYHDVIPFRTASSLWFDCSQGELQNQIQTMIKDGCHFITIEQLYNYLTSGKPLPSRPVAITFADGYEGVYKYGVQVLKQFNIHAMEFVHTGFVGSPIGRPKMTWTQIEELDRTGQLGFGSQTVTHPANLPSVHGDQLRHEMVDSRADLEMHLGHKVIWLAYPDGKFSGEDEKAAKSAGYILAFSEHQQPANLSPSIFAVNRYVHTKWKTALHDLLK